MYIIYSEIIVESPAISNRDTDHEGRKRLWGRIERNKLDGKERQILTLGKRFIEVLILYY